MNIQLIKIYTGFNTSDSKVKTEIIKVYIAFLAKKYKDFSSI